VVEISTYDIKAMDMENAGIVSSKIKKNLIAMGVDRSIVRRVAIASYEAEINVVIHSYGGYCEYEIDDEEVQIRFVDTGPGIPDVKLAMTAGWSTASKQDNEAGFGAGMGFPNMLNSADKVEVETSEKGTTVALYFKLPTNTQ